MMQSWVIPVLTLLLTLPLNGEAYLASMISPHNADQLQQIENNRAFIEAMEKNPELLSDQANQKPIVQLTDQQEQEILRHFPMIFKKGLPPAQNTTGGSDDQRLVRRSEPGECPGRRICPPYFGTQPLTLVKNEEGYLVQLVQVK